MAKRDKSNPSATPGAGNTGPRLAVKAYSISMQNGPGDFSVHITLFDEAGVGYKIIARTLPDQEQLIKTFLQKIQQSWPQVNLFMEVNEIDRIVTAITDN